MWVTDSDVGQYDVSTDGDEFWSLPGYLSPDEQSACRLSVPSLANDSRRLDHGFHLRHSAASYLQTGIDTDMCKMCKVTNAVVTCEIKLFQNYFRRLLQLMSIFQRVQCRLNDFWNISQTCATKHRSNFGIISVFYLTCNHGIGKNIYKRGGTTGLALCRITFLYNGERSQWGHILHDTHTIRWDIH